ncbi:SRPBCC family protein [Mycobacterium sp. EPa45]|uniref:SRPBCC family protein n=1 Tax=Mycobacterium sp. EPa45 TaxID=1545728 RepID=UPI000642295F|nr:SRPBCC family protein [Mycobacterium sp. EPa45]AKK27328.1 polyketide cyclase [Mycobacterium sp. EPa45]
MPTSVTRDIDAPRERVWEVLADGWTYSQWVVGNSRMRAVDADWPAPGTRILHSIGVWPAVINDETVVLSCTPQEELVLLAKLGPAGAARITLRLSDIDGGCRLEMAEVAVEGPMKFVPNRIQLAGFWPRNRESTWRLANLAADREPAEFEQS